MKYSLLAITVLSIFPFGIVTAASNSFGTLFTTASERKVINDNRYVTKKEKKITAVKTLKIETPKSVVYKAITMDYKISGVSIANNGLDSAWINGKRYESGDSLDKKTKITIYGEQRKIRFTVRGGKTFYGQSGDTITVSYKTALAE